MEFLGSTNKPLILFSIAPEQFLVLEPITAMLIDIGSVIALGNPLLDNTKAILLFLILNIILNIPSKTKPFEMTITLLNSLLELNLDYFSPQHLLIGILSLGIIC